MVYLTIKLAHLSCVALSGCLFLYRLTMLLRQGQITPAWLKTLPHVIDTLLLVSAIALCIGSIQYPWSTPWLASKLWGLLLYVCFGLLALRFLQQPPLRLAAGICALVSYAYIIGVALNRSHWSWLTLL